MLAALLLAPLLLAAGKARADVPPIDTCSKEGSSCDNAEPDGKQPGVCKKSSCSRYDPSTQTPHSYECLRCMPGRAKRAGCSTTTAPRGDGSGWPAALLAASALFCRRRS
jgi:uncharacterized protein (TIGR03382 family)